ncbi:MAG TPA: ergothioneine biosynthesis protein EgtB [Rhodocyclaceae bacterium]
MAKPDLAGCAAFAAVRARTEALAEPLSAEDCCVQSMPDASPVKWHLAHTTWFFETFVLERFESPFRAFDPAFRVLFNSYYDAIGDRHPRPRRGMLTRPSLARVLDYRRDVDARMARLLERQDAAAALRELALLGLNHEQQHQELMLTDVKHLLSLNPLQPAYLPARASRGDTPVPGLEWCAFEGGIASIGHAGAGFRYDNETPRHRVAIEPYRLASRLVTNREFLDFIAAGGYREPRLWLAEGWDWAVAGGRRGPLYWRHGAEFTLNGLAEIDPALPVVHVCYYEADAFARWAGARLPTEAEWENAAAERPIEGNFSDGGRLHPAPAAGAGLAQLYGDAWEWTSSSYGPYPGFRPAAGAVGEYNAKFMVNQQVLRGGSCATPAGHMRASYRNFFPAQACWQFSGIRLARDGS